MNLICKWYKILSIYHKDHKEFIVSNEEFIKSRFVGSLLLKFFLINQLIFLTSPINQNKSNNVDYIFVFFIISCLVVFVLLANHCEKRIDTIELKMPESKIKLIVLCWYSILIILNVILLFTGEFIRTR